MPERAPKAIPSQSEGTQLTEVEIESSFARSEDVRREVASGVGLPAEADKIALAIGKMEFLETRIWLGLWRGGGG